MCHRARFVTNYIRDRGVTGCFRNRCVTIIMTELQSQQLSFPESSMSISWVFHEYSWIFLSLHESSSVCNKEYGFELFKCVMVPKSSMSFPCVLHEHSMNRHCVFNDYSWVFLILHLYAMKIIDLMVSLLNGFWIFPVYSVCLSLLLFESSLSLHGYYWVFICLQ